MKKFIWLSFLAVLFFTLPACTKKEEKKPAAQSEQTTAAPEQSQQQPAAQTATSTAGTQNDAAQGEKIYNKVCAACHAAGIAGAPKTGDQEAWKPRIAKGMDTLYSNAIKGFQGSTGVMPPKGGATSLSDQDVKDAVDYMVQQSK